MVSCLTTACLLQPIKDTLQILIYIANFVFNILTQLDYLQ